MTTHAPEPYNAESDNLAAVDEAVGRGPEQGPEDAEGSEDLAGGGTGGIDPRHAE